MSSPYTYTLSSTQGANTIQEYSGALTANTTVVVPSTVQLYSITNNTTGAYTLTIKTAGSGSTITVSQGNTVMAISDGTNVYNANSVTSGSITTTAFPVGSAGTPSITFAGNTSTGIYLPASGQVGITLSGTLGVSFTSSGIQAPIGIVGGAF